MTRTHLRNSKDDQKDKSEAITHQINQEVAQVVREHQPPAANEAGIGAWFG